MIEHDESADHNATVARMRYLVPGTHLRISDLSDALGGYACEIVEVDDKVFWIDLPIRRDGLLDLAPGQLVSARFDRDDDAVYTFDSVVADVRFDDDAPFALANPVHIDRRAHRSDARIALVLDAEFGAGSTPDHPGKVVDLSAGGLGLICSDEMPIGGELHVRCQVPGPTGVVVVERPVVIRSKTMYARTPSGAMLHHYGLEFVEDDPDLREQILTSVIWNLTQNPAAL